LLKKKKKIWIECCGQLQLHIIGFDWSKHKLILTSKFGILGGRKILCMILE